MSEIEMILTEKPAEAEEDWKDEMEDWEDETEDWEDETEGWEDETEDELSLDERIELTELLESEGFQEDLTPLGNMYALYLLHYKPETFLCLMDADDLKNECLRMQQVMEDYENLLINQMTARLAPEDGTGQIFSDAREYTIQKYMPVF
jgi:hypothetical protein